MSPENRQTVSWPCSCTKNLSPHGAPWDSRGFCQPVLSATVGEEGERPPYLSHKCSARALDSVRQMVPLLVSGRTGLAVLYVTLQVRSSIGSLSRLPFS